MPSSRAIASSNPILTNFAVGILPELRGAIARLLAPNVPVVSTLGHFKRFDDKNAFAVYDTARALGGDRQRIEFSADDPKYDCRPQSLEITIDDEERDAAAGADPLSLEQAKTRVLVTNAALSHEKKVIDFVKANKAATADLGSWGDPDVDPVHEIDGEIVAIAKATGIMPSDIVFDIQAWQAFRLHPKVVGRQPGAEIIGLTTIQAAMLLVHPAIKIHVAAMPFDQAKTGNAQNNKFITENEVFIFHNNPTPTQYDPSFCKTFVGGRGGIDSVAMGRLPTKSYDQLWVDWSEDIQMTSSKLGRRITVDLTP